MPDGPLVNLCQLFTANSLASLLNFPVGLVAAFRACLTFPTLMCNSCVIQIVNPHMPIMQIHTYNDMDETQHSNLESRFSTPVAAGRNESADTYASHCRHLALFHCCGLVPELATNYHCLEHYFLTSMHMIMLNNLEFVIMHRLLV